MPRYKEVPTLKSLSLKGVGLFVTRMSPPIISTIKVYHEPQKIISSLQRSLDWVSHILESHVPFYLHDTMSSEVLKCVKALIDKTKRHYYPHTSMASFLTEMNVVVSLTEVVLGARLKRIDFTEWPKIMRYVLYKNLEKLSGLEDLNLGSGTGGWKTSENDKNILGGITVMKNLRSICLCFDCSDSVVVTVGENCARIRHIDVTSSRSVTDRCIPFLLKCKELRELRLHGTSVTASGLAMLIARLPKLEDIGRCDSFGNVIRCLHENYGSDGPFGLLKLQTRDLSTENLRLTVDLFPKVRCVNIFHDAEISDLTVLISLDDLRELKLLSCAFYGDYLKQLLEVRGGNLVSLHLEHSEEMNFNVLLDISEFCPELRNLVLYNCDFTHGVSFRASRSNVQPFRNLERIFWVVDGAVEQLEFVLAHALNIKHVHLGSSTGITHSTIVNVLNVNPMRNLEEFRVLYSSDMNMRTVELLLASCANLKVLSELESWQGITLEELRSFRDYVRANNFDLDIRPTLSFTN